MATIGNKNEATFTDGSGTSGDCLNVDTSQGIISIPNGKTLAFYSDAYVTLTGQVKNGNFVPPVSATAVAIGAAGTIATANIGVSRVSPVAARTGCILAAGTLNGQQCWVTNEAVVGNYIQFDVAATSNVADGINTIIPGLSARLFIWDNAQLLWYDTGQTVNGTINFAQSATAPVIAAAGTIPTAGVGVSRVAPSAARAGIILQAGTFPGQVVTVINESAAASTLTMDVSGTSNVADGTSDVITGLTAGMYIWDSVQALWYRVKAS